MIKYGLISETDGRTLEKSIDLIIKEFSEDIINFCEVGIYAGETGQGIIEYIRSNKRKEYITGIDNCKDKELVRFASYNKLIIGNSNEVYNQIEDNSQHLIFIDACHAFPYVISDFFCYADKVKVGGYIAFHDTGKHIKPFTGYQDIGSKDDPDMYISVRKALNKIKLLSNGLYIDIEEIISANVSIDEAMKIYNQTGIQVWNSRDTSQWQLIFDEADINDEAGGMCVFKKLY